MRCSCARRACVTPMSASSTTLARWKVGPPSDLTMIKSSSSSRLTRTSPRTRSLTVISVSGILNLQTWGVFFSSNALICCGVRFCISVPSYLNGRFACLASWRSCVSSCGVLKHR